MLKRRLAFLSKTLPIVLAHCEKFITSLRVIQMPTPRVLRQLIVRLNARWAVGLGRGAAAPLC